MLLSEKTQEFPGPLQMDVIRDCLLLYVYSATVSSSPISLGYSRETPSEISRLEIGTSLYIHVCPKFQRVQVKFS